MTRRQPGQLSFATAEDGTELGWRSEGAGEPLLLIAGQATGMAGWGPTADALAARFRVICYDHRGIGASGRGLAQRYSTRLLAADARSVLQVAGVESAHVYGHSMGGRIAQWLAIDHPGTVRALVLAATSAGRSGQGADKDAIAALTSGDPAAMSPYFFDPDWAARNSDAVRTFFASKASAWAKSRHFAASTGHDALGQLPSITAPTLILHGTEDRLSPLANARMLHRAIPHSTLVKVQGARHGLHLDHPKTVQWIMDFIEKRVTAGKALQ